MPRADSSAITRIEWKAGTLSVWFRETGRRYDYPDFPQALYQSFLASESKGEFFNDHIRDQYRAIWRR